MSTSIARLHLGPVQAMSTSTPRNSCAGDTNPRGHLRSPPLKLYVRSLQNRSEEKIGCLASAAFGGRPRLWQKLIEDQTDGKESLPATINCSMIRKPRDPLSS